MEQINENGITEQFKNKFKRILIDNAEQIQENYYNQWKDNQPPNPVKKLSEWEFKQLQLEKSALQFAQSFKTGKAHYSEDGQHKWITSLEDGKVKQYTQMEKKEPIKGENPFEWVLVDEGTQEQMWNKRGYGSKVSPYNTDWDFKINTDYSEESE